MKVTNLDRDVELPERDAAKDLAAEVHDNVVGAVYRKLMEIESRLREGCRWRPGWCAGSLKVNCCL